MNKADGFSMRRPSEEPERPSIWSHLATAVKSTAQLASMEFDRYFGGFKHPEPQPEPSVTESQSYTQSTESRKRQHDDDQDTAHASKMRKIQEIKAVLRELEQDSPPPRYERVCSDRSERHNERDRMLLLEQRIEAIQSQVAGLVSSRPKRVPPTPPPNPILRQRKSEIPKQRTLPDFPLPSPPPPAQSPPRCRSSPVRQLPTALRTPRPSLNPAKAPANDSHRSSMKEIVEQIPNVKLRRTDMVRAPDGSMRPNPIWVEIYEPKRRYKRPRPTNATESNGLTKRRHIV